MVEEFQQIGSVKNQRTEKYWHSQVNVHLVRGSAVEEPKMSIDWRPQQFPPIRLE